MRKLRLEDIEDLREYERHRPEYLKKIIELKKRRRVALGPIMTVVFENPDTVRFQIQEMARAEKMTTDEQIETELRIYNSLLPDDGWLSATLFIELPTREQLYEWLPKLVGIEKSLYIRIGEGSAAAVIEGVPEAEHEETLSREDVTASVHYVQFPVGVERKAAFEVGPVYLGVKHENYSAEVELGENVRREIASDLG